MKILLLLQARKLDDQKNYLEAFSKARLKSGDRVNVVALPFIGLYDSIGSDGFCRKAIECYEKHKPDVVFFQFFHGTTPNPKMFLDYLVTQREKPLIFASQGDPFWIGFGECIARPPEPNMKVLLPYVDAYFSSSMGELGARFVELGARNVIFLPHAWSNQHFGPVTEENTADFQYDVMMCCGVQRWPGLKLPLQISSSIFQRYIAAGLLRSAFGRRFALYGRGWFYPWAKGSFRFGAQVDLYRKARVVVDAPPPIYATYYASDRPFFVVGSGTPLVMPYVSRFEKVFKDDEHVYYARGLRNLPIACKRVLSLPEDVLAYRRRNLLELIKNRHTTESRVDTILSVYEALIDFKSGLKTDQEALSALRLWHFLPDVDIEEERKYSVFNWDPNGCFK